VAQGSPEAVSVTKDKSHTARVLRRFLRERANKAVEAR
jgi:hypothetical protein